MATIDARRPARSSVKSKILGRARIDPSSDQRLYRSLFSTPTAKRVRPRWRCSAIALETARRSDLSCCLGFRACSSLMTEHHNVGYYGHPNGYVAYIVETN